MKSKASNCAMPSRKLDAVLFWFKKQVGPTDHYTLNLWTQLNKWSHWPVYSQLLWKLKNRILHPSGQLLQGVSLQVHQPGMGTVKRWRLGSYSMLELRIAPETEKLTHLYELHSIWGIKRWTWAYILKFSGSEGNILEMKTAWMTPNQNIQNPFGRFAW